jgi:transketolase
VQTLLSIPTPTFSYIRQSVTDPVAATRLLADCLRLNVLTMVRLAGSGHLGTSFSSMELLTWLWGYGLKAPNQPGVTEGDVFFSSKGHDAPALYAAFIALGLLPEDALGQLRRLNGLPGHPDRLQTPMVWANTGSLGMGISKGKGVALAKRLQGKAGRVYVLCGDGELQEGQIWESLQGAANQRLQNLTVLVDVNRVQSDTFTEKTHPMRSLRQKFEAFGWHVTTCNGHDPASIRLALTICQAALGLPQVILADTVKGHGVSFMSHTAMDAKAPMPLYSYHSGAPSDADYHRALEELRGRIDATMAALHLTPIAYRTWASPSAASSISATCGVQTASGNTPQRLIPAYGQALLAAAETHPNLVVLDADLMVDCGLAPFRQRYPQRFIECGIAEQDMVSIAGGLALSNQLPVVHSFAAFLSARPNEQIFNNASEATRIIYAATLAGVLPASPGHSHQAVRDISALAAVPNLTLFAPGCEDEVVWGLQWALQQHPGAAYLRLESFPVDLPYAPTPPEATWAPGQGRWIVSPTAQTQLALVAYGPTLLKEAWLAAHMLEDVCGAPVAVMNFPWLNHVDTAWLESALDGLSCVVSLDNHATEGGLGQRLAATALQELGVRTPKWLCIGVEGLPGFGTPQEALIANGLAANAVAQRAARWLGPDENKPQMASPQHREEQHNARTVSA